MRALCFCLVFCIRTTEPFEIARAERFKVSGNPIQYDDQEIFLEEQKLLRGLVNETILPSFGFDISDSNVTRTADRIAVWFEETGGCIPKKGQNHKNKNER